MGKKQLILSDKELWEKFLAGDDKSITVVYKRYADELFSYGLKIANDKFLVKDCIQDVFINLIDNRRKIEITSEIHLYLFRSLRNKILDELRSGSRKQVILKKAFHSNDVEGANSIENELIQSEERMIIQKEINLAIESLTDKQKEILYLKYTKGLDYDEIAKILDIDISSARTLLYRTLKSIKEKLSRRALLFFTVFKPQLIRL